MKGDRQLNQTLQVQMETPARWPVARQGAPDVFENFMSVEKLGAVKQIETSLELPIARRNRRNRQPP
jgi:hypothetical protein